MRWFAVLALLLSASAARAASDRAVLSLAIAGTRAGPPDLSALIVKHRKEYLAGAREAARRAAPADFAAGARGIAHAILSRTPFPEVIRQTGAIVGGVLAAEAPTGDDDAFERASAGPFRFPGVAAAAAAGDPSPVARSIARARADSGAPGGAEALAARIVTDETNLLWAIWTAAGGDARPAKKFDERNGPYVIAGAPR